MSAQRATGSNTGAEFRELKDWLVNLTDVEVRDLTWELLSVEERAKLPAPVDRGTFVAHMQTTRKAADLRTRLESLYLDRKPRLEGDSDDPVSGVDGHDTSSDDDSDSIPFSNRSDDLSSLTSNTLGSRYIVIHAPTQYGKSALLARVRDTYQERKWQAVIVPLDPSDHQPAIADKLCKALALNHVPSAKHSLGTSVSAAWKHKYQNEQSSGTILMFDFGGCPCKSLVNYLFQEFLPDFSENIDGLPDFENGVKRLLVLIAGRGLREYATDRSHGLSLVGQRGLSVFAYHSVFDTAQSYLRKVGVRATQPTLANLAAHMMHVSGGHPGGMAKILVSYRQSALTVERYFGGQKADLWKTIMGPIVDSVLGDLPAHIQAAPELNQLCVFRYVDKAVLRSIAADGMGRHFIMSLLQEDHDSRYYSDPVVRRLVVTKLRSEQPNELKVLCESAKDQCLNRIRAIEVCERWVIEYLFQELQLKSEAELDSVQGRKSFFEQYMEEVVPTVIEAAKAAQVERGGMFSDFADALLVEIGSERQHEFRFLFSYCMRGKNYSDEKMSELIDRIRRLLVG